MTRRERLRELDLLRFAAALAVVLYHFTGFGGAGAWPAPSQDVFPEIAPVTRFGYLGVDLFFVISGFVILMSAWGRGPGEFGISRLVRLMPAYWVSVLLGAAVYAVFRMGHGVPGLIVPNLTMLQGGLGLRNVDADALGVVLNMVPARSMNKSSYGYGYGYGYGYAPDAGRRKAEAEHSGVKKIARSKKELADSAEDDDRPEAKGA